MLLVQRPKLLLLDEPVAGMTRAERQATGELLQALAGDRTVVVVEHDMAFVRRFARAVTVLHEGRILCEGTCGPRAGRPPGPRGLPRPLPRRAIRRNRRGGDMTTRSVAGGQRSRDE